MTSTGVGRRVDTPGHPGAAAEVLPARIWSALRTLVLESHDRRKAVCAALDMSFVRAKAVRRLAAGPLTMRELAATLGTDAPYTTLIVHDLEERGLVARSAHPADRRVKIVTATPAGLRAAEVAESILGQPPAALAQLDQEDLVSLDRIIMKVAVASRNPPKQENPAVG